MIRLPLLRTDLALAVFDCATFQLDTSPIVFTVMANQLWWIQSVGEVVGPLPSAHVRHMAAERTIHPETLVSQDGSKWFPAGKLRGLFPEAVTSPPTPTQVPDSASSVASPVRDQEESRQRRTNVDLDGQLPLIRLHRKLWKTEVLALYDSHVLLGTRHFSAVRLTEEMCHPSGKQVLAGHCHQVHKIDYARIESVREEVQLTRHGSEFQPHVHHFEIRGEHQRLRFSVQPDQVENVRGYLAHRLSERYQWRNQGRTPWMLLLGLFIFFGSLLIFGIALELQLLVAVGFAAEIGCCVWTSYFWMRRGEAWLAGVPTSETKHKTPPPQANPFANLLVGSLIVVGVGIALFFIAPAIGLAWCLFGALGAGYAGHVLTRLPSNASPFPSDSARRDRGVENLAKQPFRSAIAGWALKLSGLVYWMLIASPLSDGISGFLATYQSGPWGFAIWSFIWAPTAVLIYCGYRLCQEPFCPETISSGDRFILFLRPFTEDGAITLQPSGWLAKIAGLRGSFLDTFHSGPEKRRVEAGRINFWDRLFEVNPARLIRMVFNFDAATAEEALVRFFRAYAPVMAIGKPGEALATPGAQRVYLKNEAWQDVAGRAISEAQVIVIQPGRTAGVRWELERIYHGDRRGRPGLKSPQRLLLCMVSFWKEPQAYEELTSLVKEAMGIELPRVVPFLRTPVFIYFGADWKPKVQAVSYKCPLLWPLTGNAVDLGHCLRPFLDGCDGYDSAQPRSPNWVQGYGTAVASIAGLFMALILMIAPVAGVDYLLRTAFAQFKSSPIDSSESMLADTSWKTLNGRAATYSLSIPASLVETEAPSEVFEHCFQSPDAHVVVRVGGSVFNENVSHILEPFTSSQRQGFSNVRVQSTRRIEASGVKWTETRLLLNLPDEGHLFRESVRAYSDDHGTIFIQVQEAAENEYSATPVTDRILASVKLEQARDPVMLDSQESPMITLTGRTVPYSLSVPTSLTKIEDANYEHHVKSQDGRFWVTVGTIATPLAAADHTGEQLVQSYRKTFPESEAWLESPNRPVEAIDVAGVKWIETRFRVRHAASQPLRRYRARLFSDERGTVVISAWEIIAGDRSYARIADAILASARLEKSENLDDRLVGRWESVGNPFPIIQEFSNDGQSKITIAGSTVTGTYKLNGDEIDWNSGATNVKAKVKFLSATEMELSNEAGIRVTYKKSRSQQRLQVVNGNGPTDLLQLIDAQRDAVAGQWKFDGKTLITGAKPCDRLEIPCAVPVEYRLTLVASCRAHREALHIGLVAGSNQVLAIFDGWSRTSTCLHMIDRTDGVQFPHHHGSVLHDGTPNVITCEVRANRILVDCNGIRVIDWTGDFNRLSTNPDWKVRSAKSLFIGSWDTHFEISKLELSPL